jgi:hypothetical protein
MDAESVATPEILEPLPSKESRQRTRVDVFLNDYRHIISASTASVAGLIVGFPIDTVKVGSWSLSSSRRHQFGLTLTACSR